MWMLILLIFSFISFLPYSGSSPIIINNHPSSSPLIPSPVCNYSITGSAATSSAHTIQLGQIPCIEPQNTCTDKKVDIMLAIDKTSSMGEILEGSNKAAIEFAKEAAVSFTDAIIKSPVGSSGNIRLGLETYGNDTAEKIAGLSNNYSDVIDKINSIPSPEGSTCIFCALQEANNELINNPPPDGNSEKIIILITDGNANTGSSNPKQDAIDEANRGKNENIIYYVIGFTPIKKNTGTHDYDIDVQKSIASDPDDTYHFIKPDPSTWASAYEQILQNICTTST
jgi:hypothetical protein